MHLVSRSDQRVSVAGDVFEFIEGETVHTENSYKYAPDEFDELARSAGFDLDQRWLDDRGWFAVNLYRAR